MNKKIAFSTLTIILFTSASFATASSIKENIFDKEKGFFTCSGGASASILKQDCKELNLARVSFGGSIVYEGSCLDNNGTKYVLSCISFLFEPDHVTPTTKKNYFDQ